MQSKNIKKAQAVPHGRPVPCARSGMAAFTLIEMMVSVSLFLIVMVISLGAVLAIVDGNKKAQAINSVSNNLSSAIESMVRDIKTGYAYTCGDTVVPLGDTTFGGGAGSCDPAMEQVKISFISTISGDKRRVTYRFGAEGARGYIEKTFCPAAKPTCTAADYNTLQITSPDIDIERLGFWVNRPKPSSAVAAIEDKGQPNVFVLIKGTAYVNKTSASDFSMQTLISQRVLNI